MVAGPEAARRQGIARDEASAGAQPACGVSHDLTLRAGWNEDQHVAGHDDEVEGPTAEVQPGVGQVALDPGEIGCLGAGRSEHRLVEVDPDDVEAPSAELDGHPAGATAGVEDGRRGVGGDERRLAVHVHAGGGQVFEAPVVVRPAWTSLSCQRLTNFLLSCSLALLLVLLSCVSCSLALLVSDFRGSGVGAGPATGRRQDGDRTG